MEYRQLGATGPRVSALGLGLWSIGGAFGPADTAESRRTIARAIERGVTLIDTAPAYGSAEALLGEVLSPADRQRVFLTTKCGLAPDPLTGRSVLDGRPEALRQHLEGSLRRLRCDWVDLLLIHWPDTRVPIAETIGGLDDLRRDGLTRFVGVSNFTAEQLRAACREAPIVCNQVGYHLFDRRWERAMFPTAAECGVAIVAYSPLAHGLLSGSFDTGTLHPADWRRQGDTLASEYLFAPENIAHNAALARRMAESLEGRGVTLPQAAIAWVLAHPQVASTITGSRRVERLDENLAALEVAMDAGWRDHLSALAGAAQGLRDDLPTWPLP
jgi:aryl-alcohol dehydrogenase-like predicted oxidoreductase